MTTIRHPAYTVRTPTGWRSVGQISGITGGAPDPDWAEEFDTLDMTTSSHVGRWRPNDFWQNVNAGYEDFAGTSWNANPNDGIGINPFSIADSVLTITCQRTPPETVAAIEAEMVSQGVGGTAPAWTGGILITNDAVRRFLYGYFEWRVRFPQVGRGMFPALWLYHASGEDTKPDAEIDVFEIFGSAAGSPVVASYHQAGNGDSISTSSPDVTGWHRYGLDWQPSYLRLYVDDEMVGELTGAAAEWFDVPMQVRLNYSMDAPWFPTKSNGTTPDPLTMEVDYIRHWAVKP